MPTNTSGLTGLGQDALAYASHGFLIFPLWHLVRGVCQCSARDTCGSPGKHPRTRAGLNEASSDEHTIERWWSMWPFANIGLPAGANGLAVVDIDPDHGGNATIEVLDAYCLDRGADPRHTRTILTGSGGHHRIYQQPAGGIPSKRRAFGDDAPGVDTRGRGGYIVAPPSLHATGRRYQVIDNGFGIAPWPQRLTELLEQASEFRGELPDGTIACGPAGAQLTSGDRGAVWAYHALLSETKKLADLPLTEGSGKNDQLNASAYKLGRRIGAGYLDEQSAEIALYNAVQHWIGYGHTDRSIRATIRSGLAAGIRNPHPGPATRGGAR